MTAQQLSLTCMGPSGGTMLSERTIPRGMERKVCICTTDPALRQVLAGLLEGWRFSLQPEIVDGVLLLAEEGCCEAPPDQPVLWLGHSRYSSRDKLPLPLPIEELYTRLEHRFHRPPRRHMRLDIDLSARVCCRGGDYASNLTSLSDRGGRLRLPMELAREEELELEFSLAGRPMSLAASVIYSFQRPGAVTDGYDTGVLFARQVQEECEQLREFILGRYLARLRERLAPEVFSAGLAYFTLPPALQQFYGGSQMVN
ncbi:hypothetical protein C2E25_13055 [Geothermobacter hydrogeniphilus]|uniref:PilZ domain-containing protein n=2 Tax=Geothermobacter hydrogeniphilus TaxID=1969733 RepID=A0A2K2H7P7_9BACT|nr:hypothetical protein C2E25_13055 [Geothermobacter hydrogeniphilus]